MSRHTFRLCNGNEKIVTVVLGYDRPLNYVFCTVTREGEEDNPIYTNLADRRAGTRQQNVNYFRPVLARLGIEVPEKMFLEVELDQFLRIGNRDVDHTLSQ